MKKAHAKAQTREDMASDESELRASAPSRASETDLWVECILQDIATTTSGGTPDRKRAEFFGGPIPWVKSGELNDRHVFEAEESLTEEGLSSSSAKLFPPGTLMVAMYGATVGKTAVLRVEAATNQAICAIFPNAEKAGSDFLRFFLISERAELLKQRYGGAQPNISQNVIRNFPIRLPPLSEQRRIAGVLGLVQRAVEQQERLLALVAELKQTLLHHLFTHGLRGEPQKPTDLGPIPQSWEVVELGSLSTTISKGSSPKWQGFEYVPEGVLFVRSQNVGAGRMLFPDRVFVPPSFNEQERRSILQNEDILINLVGASIGRVALATPDVKGANCNQAVGFVRMERSRSFKQLVVCYLLSPSGQRQMFLQQKDIARANLSLLDVRALKVPLPSDDESAAIAEVFTQVERKIAVVTAKHSALTSLFRTLLHQLMTAQLRVSDLDVESLLSQAVPEPNAAQP